MADSDRATLSERCTLRSLHGAPTRSERDRYVDDMPWARLLSLAVVGVCLVACAGRQVSAASSKDQAGTFQYGGLKRTYTLHVPPGPPVA